MRYGRAYFQRVIKVMNIFQKKDQLQTIYQSEHLRIHTSKKNVPLLRLYDGVFFFIQNNPKDLDPSY